MKKIVEPKYRVETHYIKPGTPAWYECDDICWKAKNLYNQGNFRIRQKFIHEGERLHYPTLQKQLQAEHADCYLALPAKVAQSLLKRLNDAWTGFYRASAEFKKNPQKFSGEPRLPGYLDINTGRAATTFNSQAYSKKALNLGRLKLSSLDFELNLKTKAEEIEVEYLDTATGEVTKETICNIRDVSIVPKDFGYEVEVKYLEKFVAPVVSGYSAGCDIGVNNLAAVVTNNKAFKPILISGGPLKAMNAFYNKELAKLRAEEDTCTSKRRLKAIQREIYKLGVRRSHKMKDYIHKAAKLLVQELQQAEVSHLVIGKNINWKQKVNLGSKKANQNFAQIPHAKFIQVLTHKCERVGIFVETHEESFTSKCSFLDKESIGVHANYKGVRLKRGLFISAERHLLNADVNGAGNILRKAISNAFDLWSKADLIQGFVVSPRRLIVPHLKKMKQEPVEIL